MAWLLHTATKSKMSKTKQSANVPLRTGLFAFLGAFAGMALAIPLALNAIAPSLRQTAATTPVNTIMTRPASNTVACTESAGVLGASTGGQGQVLGASASYASPPKEQSSPSPNVTSTSKVVKAAQNALSISMTGPDSTNKIIVSNMTKSTTSNVNNIDTQNNNSQSATSGTAKSSGNTTGGAATTGSAVNTSNAQISLSIDN